MDPDHVYTRDELINTIADFTAGLSDDVKASIDAKALGSLENLADGIKQFSARLDQAKQTIANVEKTNEDYKAKIASYAALQADRMKADLKTADSDSDPVQDALDTVAEEDDE